VVEGHPLVFKKGLGILFNKFYYSLNSLRWFLMFPCAKDAFDFNGNSTIKLAKLVLERKLSWVMTSCLDLQHRSHSLNMQKMAHISK